MAKKAIRPIRIEGNVAYVPLTKGYEAIIDAADAPLVENYHWHAMVRLHPNGTIRTVYAVRSERAEGKKWLTHYMHRVVAGTPHDMDTDHRDGNGLDNRRENLRNASRAQNVRNQRIRTSNTSGVKGVTWNKAKGKWVAFICVNGKKRYLGQFISLEDASSAYRAASKDLHGEFSTR